MRGLVTVRGLVAEVGSLVGERASGRTNGLERGEMTVVIEPVRFKIAGCCCCSSFGGAAKRTSCLNMMGTRLAENVVPMS